VVHQCIEATTDTKLCHMAASGRNPVGSKLSLVTLACPVHYLDKQHPHPTHHISPRVYSHSTSLPAEAITLALQSG
jgi:hypothetical protein